MKIHLIHKQVFLCKSLTKKKKKKVLFILFSIKNSKLLFFFITAIENNRLRNIDYFF